MKSTTNLKLVLVLALLIVSVILLQSCGNDTSVPDGSTLTISPSSVSQANVTFDAIHNFTVRARYQDGTPIPYAMIHISGSFAVPVSDPRYQFYYYPEGPAKAGGNTLVDSGFDGQTDKYGVYVFSIVVYADKAFKDDINFNSGTATASATVTATTST